MKRTRLDDSAAHRPSNRFAAAPRDVDSSLPVSVWKQRLRRAVLNWFADHARDLPWRPSPGLYETWVSEIMLQQTQVTTVIPYYRRFLERFPSVAQLARASEQEVLRYWEGLGYYRRARQLHAAARQVVEHHGGQFPTLIEAVRELPGIGRYTAGAILSIALDQRHPIVEANTVRLLSRLLAYPGDPRSAAGQARLWSFAQALLPRRRVGDFNQALMEVGSVICLPRQPACDICPVAALCPTRRQGLQAEIPRPKPKSAAVPLIEAAVVVARDDGRVLLRRCRKGERWEGLWDFPRFSFAQPEGPQVDAQLRQGVASLTGLEVAMERPLTTIRHGVTRFRITLHCHLAVCTAPSRLRSQQKWVAPQDLGSYPLSVTGRKIARFWLDLNQRSQ